MDYIRRKKHRGTSTRHINNQSVYNLVSNIPPGKVATYGQLASSVGNPRAARGIGKILNKNPRPIIVPCHRVVCSDGHIGGYMYGKERKISLLLNEGIPIVNDLIKDFEKYRV
ncbi:MAG TPA: MGMT family protein [Nitrososphaeraceae archaeon]|jgi:methylated-DNA-[protein]-cysteine S-methyltransferase|nr:MGMT family protein [Nitrososphaeraceae archaeon]